MLKGLRYVLPLILSVTVSAEELQRQERRFIACPVYRDTDAGPKSGCWLATMRESGEQFDIGSGLTKPLSDRAVLVEGVVAAEGADACGAPVLQPVRVSVLGAPCAEHIIPAEGFPGRVFRPPGEVMQPLTVPRQLPAGPFENKTFTILFNFDSDFLNYQYSEVILEKAALYIKASHAKEVRIVGHSATEPYAVSGETLREEAELGRARAAKVATALRRLGIPENVLRVQTKRRPKPVAHYADGLAEETKRRVEIHILVN